MSLHTRLPVIVQTCISQPYIRCFTSSSTYNATKVVSNKAKSEKEKARKRRKKHVSYKMPNLKDIKRFSLCDAMQYIRAFEVGRDPTSPKYDLAIRLRTKRDGPVLRNTIKLPFSVSNDIRVCVLVDPDGKVGKAAKAAGASIVGTEQVFQQIKDGQIDFERCITTPEMLDKIQKAGLPRILGPRGLMPSVKLGPVTDDIFGNVRNLVGGSTYREREGVVRMAIGQLAFTPEMVRDNMKVFISQLKSEAAKIVEGQGNFSKEIFEIVMSSQHSPGFSLDGRFRSEESIDTALMAKQ